MIYQCFILRLDCPGPFHKIMTVSNEKIDYILKQRVWQHSFNIAVTSQNNLIERIFGLRMEGKKVNFYTFIFQEHESNHINYTKGGHVCDSCSDVVNSFKYSKIFGNSNTRNRKRDWCVFTRFCHELETNIFI